jgi:lipoyl-dependent peroxiredoxin
MRASAKLNPDRLKTNRLNKEPMMSQIEKLLYTAKARTTGGRDGGTSRTDDGRLDIKLSSPGTSDTGTNPEQLFAAGWSACFLSAIKLIAGKKKITLPPDAAIDAEVDLGTEHGNFQLAARLNVSLPGMEREAAQALVEAAHQVCPYSRATRGNVDVALNVVNAGLRKAS